MRFDEFCSWAARRTIGKPDRVGSDAPGSESIPNVDSSSDFAIAESESEGGETPVVSWSMKL